MDCSSMDCSSLRDALDSIVVQDEFSLQGLRVELKAVIATKMSGKDLSNLFLVSSTWAKEVRSKRSRGTHTR